MESPYRSKKTLIIISCMILLICFVCVSIFTFAIWGGKGEPATLKVATEVSQKFIEYIHDDQIDLAHSMLSEKFYPSVTKEQFAALIQADERIFRTYRKLEICDWGFYISNGRVIDANGLLYYENGVIAVRITLHKDADGDWRIQGFQFRPNAGTNPFGLCK